MTFDYDVVALGEAMVEFNQASQNDGRMYLQGFGGDTSNTIIAAARQGARSAYVTLLGQDTFGEMFLKLWQAEGVDVSAVGVRSDAPTAVYFVRHDADGHHFSYLRKGSAASRIAPGDLRNEVIGNTRFLHVSGISQAISASARDTVAKAIAVARGAGARISYDPNLRLALWPLADARQVIIETIAMTDEFLPGLDEMSQVSGLKQAEDIIDWAHRHGAKVVVLKLGDQGVFASDGTTRQKIAALPVQALDATGAGDCFDGAYLAKRAKGGDVFSSARWAVASAAMSTLGFGAVAPLPTGAQVAEFLQTRQTNAGLKRQ